jgi:hypothetical protein
MNDGASFLLVDDKLSVLHVIAKRRQAAHPHAFFLEAAILSRMRSPATSRSNCANESSTFRVSRPIEVVVLNCGVIDTKDEYGARCCSQGNRKVCGNLPATASPRLVAHLPQRGCQTFDQHFAVEWLTQHT